MDQATHDVAAPGRARTLHGISYGIHPLGRVEVQAAVGPPSVVVRRVLAKDALEVAPPPDERPVQALRTGRAAHRSAKAFARGARNGVPSEARCVHGPLRRSPVRGDARQGRRTRARCGRARDRQLPRRRALQARRAARRSPGGQDVQARDRGTRPDHQWSQPAREPRTPGCRVPGARSCHVGEDDPPRRGARGARRDGLLRLSR
jgi:hypothetical protein